MKRFLSAVLVILLLLCITACGNHDNSKKSDSKSENAYNENNAAFTDPGEEINYDKTVVFDNEFCKLSVVKINDKAEGYDGQKFYTIYFEAVNKTDKKILFELNESYFNGVYLKTSVLGFTVVGNSTEEARLEYDYDDLAIFERYGLSDFTDIEMKMDILDVENNSSKLLAKERFNIYPYGEENAVVYDRADENDIAVVSVDGVKVVAVGNYYTDELFVLDLFICSTLDDELTLQFSDTVNGVNVESDNYISTYKIRGGKNRFISLSWKTADLQAAGITDVNEIDLWIVAETYNTSYICDSYIVSL